MALLGVARTFGAGLDIFEIEKSAMAPMIFGKLCDPCMLRAANDMVIDHANRLHEGVDDCWPAEFEAAFLQVF